MNSTIKIALLLALFGSLSFIFGVVAENKKPASGAPVSGDGVVTCEYPSDPTIGLGVSSILTLVVAAVIGHVAVFCPYEGKSVPAAALFRSASLVVFIIVAEAFSGVALVLMMWATITESLHRTYNVHRNLDTDCPTAKTGLFGGAAFLALDAALFWLVCQMLTLNARADHLDEGDHRGEYGQVYAADIDSTGDRNKV